jgi:hypothetical protein
MSCITSNLQQVAETRGRYLVIIQLVIINLKIIYCSLYGQILHMLIY